MRATICPRVRELAPLAAKRPFEGYLAYPFLPEILPKRARDPMTDETSAFCGLCEDWRPNCKKYRFRKA